jgi:hypothetical protein
VSGIKAEVDRIDGLLRTIDQYLDVFQPPVTGKVRIVFNKYRTELRPELRVFLKSRSGTWRSNRIAKGMGTRSLRRARAFERHYDTVKVLCRAAERLLEERAPFDGPLAGCFIGVEGSAEGQQRDRHTPRLAICRAPTKRFSPAFNRADAPGRFPRLVSSYPAPITCELGLAKTRR